MPEETRKAREWRELDALENIATELLRLRVLREHELGVQLEENEESGPYVATRHVPIVEK
jgi:hypothetical protein